MKQGLLGWELIRRDPEYFNGHNRLKKKCKCDVSQLVNKQIKQSFTVEVDRVYMLNGIVILKVEGFDPQKQQTSFSSRANLICFIA